MKLSISSFLSNLAASNKKHKSKKARSISRTETFSFGSCTASSSSDESVSYRLQSTPKSVLASSPNDLKISREELEMILRRLCTDPPSDEEFSAIVAVGDGDGCISIADLGKICGSDGEEDLKDAFKVFDVNGDGKISAEELLDVFMAMGDEDCTIEDCKRMIGGVDSDGDGLVCFSDFARMMECKRAGVGL
ncbi:hypothetical protein LUZ60_003632 [Juncus effusus]|nr:hypothetical protein LUZ60_003632 [Juncus effusus]